MAGFISERWPASNRNGGRLQIGINGRIGSEFAIASQQKTVNFIVEQMEQAGTVFAKRMFGEYSLCLDGKLFALVCDNQLLSSRRRKAGLMPENRSKWPPIPARLVGPERWDDADWLANLTRITAGALPPPVNKRKKTVREGKPKSRP